MAENMQIKPGDRVEIRSKGIARTGVVKSANNYGTMGILGQFNDWYIEMTTEDGDPVYWKQALDGGSVRKL